MHISNINLANFLYDSSLILINLLNITPSIIYIFFPILASNDKAMGTPIVAYKIQKTLPPLVLGARFPYPEKITCPVKFYQPML